MLKYEVNYDIKLGSVIFFRYGKFHRTNNAAIMWSNGSLHRFHYGNRHRKNGPAIMWSDGDKEYWVRGKQCSNMKFG